MLMKTRKSPEPEYFPAATVGEWEETGLYKLADPDYSSLFPATEQHGALKEVLQAGAAAVHHRNCAVLRSSQLGFGEWHVMIYLNDSGEVIPHVTLSQNVANVTAALSHVVASLYRAAE